MAEITIYTVALDGEVKIQADDEATAKSEALDYFSQSPQSYLRITEVETVIVPED